MALRLPPTTSYPDDDNDSNAKSTDSEDDDDQNWDDWESDSIIGQHCKSLFDDSTYPSVSQALEHDKNVNGFDLNQTCLRLSLDAHGRIRLINYIRKNMPPANELTGLQGTESLFGSDEYLRPVLEDDPLLRISDDWSDSEDGGSSSDPVRRIRSLENRLIQAQQDLAEYRSLVARKLNISDLLESSNEPDPLQSTALKRDDDSHYFESYGAPDIHAIMIQDKVRTSTYAHFILTNPTVFRDAIVLDVGCGTGILSLFAARGGAKRVIAVDASDIAERAEKIVKANGFENIITVIRGKIEQINLPDNIQKVDIIISEWMGYALLYESMLDSVLCARDRFLKPNGVMAPSQCKMMLALCNASEVHKDRIGFWNDVYGFDMSVMITDLYNEAIVDVVGSEAVLSKPYTIKELLLSEVTSRQLDFSTKFQITSTAERRTVINSFVLYFDTFFTVDGSPIPLNTEVKTIKEGEAVLAELWPVGGKPAPQRRRSLAREKERVTSFSTGPRSSPTHWKQTIFMLKEPINASEGTIVNGVFHCRKNNTNSRELDVEIHYGVRKDAESPQGETIVQMYKVR